jgi:hypothetical protein
VERQRACGVGGDEGEEELGEGAEVWFEPDVAEELEEEREEGVLREG